MDLLPENLLENAELYVTSLLSSKLPLNNYYHNALHTRRVVKKVKELVEREDCSDTDKDFVILAAWFHDTGFINTEQGHEIESAKICLEYLKTQNVTENIQKKIEQLILATQIDHVPETNLEKIIRDADNSHFGLDNYMEIAEYLRKEINTKNNLSLSDSEWFMQNINFLRKHNFHTITAQKEWQPQKEINLLNLSLAIDESLQKKKKKKKPRKLGRGVETMYRIQDTIPISV